MFMALILPAFLLPSEARAARMKARIFSASFTPGALSTPDDTSTAGRARDAQRLGDVVRHRGRPTA